MYDTTLCEVSRIKLGGRAESLMCHIYGDGVRIQEEDQVGPGDLLSMFFLYILGQRSGNIIFFVSHTWNEISSY